MIVGKDSTQIAGDRAKLTAGDDCTLMGSDKSVLTAGKNSILVGGARSKLIGSLGSTLTGGENATLIFRCWNGKRYKNVVARTGKDGVEAHVPYQVDEADNLVSKTDE